MKKMIDACSKSLLTPYLERRKIQQSHSLGVQHATFQRLKKYLDRGQVSTDLGLQYCSSYEDFLEKVPQTDWEFYASYTQNTLDGVPNQFFPGVPDCFVLSSGTSGYLNKKIPYNKAMSKAITEYQTLIIAKIVADCPNANPLTSERFTYTSAPPADTVHEIFDFQYASTLIASKSPKFIQNKVFPRPETLLIEDWDTKINRIVDEVKGRDIRIAVGIPLYLVHFFEKILQATGRSTMKELWPNLEAVFYSGSSIDSFHHQLNGIAGKPLKYFGGYLASEGAFGWPAATTGHFHLMTNHFLFGFLPLDRDSASPLGIHQVEVGETYELLTSAPNGLLQYKLGDLVKVESTSPLFTISVVGRRASMMNVCSEKIDMSLLKEAFQRTNTGLNLQAEEFFIHPDKDQDGKSVYSWTIFSDNQEIESELLRDSLDQNLKEIAPSYFETRELHRVLGKSLATVVPKKIRRQLFESRADQGQFKMHEVLRDRQHLESLITKLPSESAAHFTSSTQVTTTVQHPT